MNSDSHLMVEMIEKLQKETWQLDEFLATLDPQTLQYSAVERQAWRLRDAIEAFEEACRKDIARRV